MGGFSIIGILRPISAAALRWTCFINNEVTAKLFSRCFSLTDVADEDSLCDEWLCVPLLERFDLVPAELF